MENPAKLIDHTLLAPTATPQQIANLCAEAREHDFFSVCVSPTYVQQAVHELEESDVKVCTVVGFPSGAHLSSIKAAETAAAVADGADEIDMVINLGAVKNADWGLVESDIHAVVRAAGSALVKVILETCLLTDSEIERACELSVRAGADFVKTSTGFSTHGATVEHVALMRKSVGPFTGVKASAGIRTKDTFESMVAAGASRIGASAGAALL